MAEGNVLQISKQAEKITIGDVAEALGVSKTTVSRAISGKGRISEATRTRVLKYIKENDYQPSPIAKGLAQSKTYNLGWVIPGDYSVSDLPFFQRCMMGISEVAALNDYDVLVTLVFDHDISRLEKIVRNHKVDGVILGRTLMKDRRTEFLKESEIPFVVIGSTPVDGVIQVDNDHIEACKELTSILVMKGIRKFVLIGGGLNHVVNQTRYNGFMQALKDNNIDIDEDDIYTDITGGSDFGGILDEILRKGTECIVCMDDAICIRVLERCRNDGISIPKDIKVASFYNSPILSNYQPAITCLQYDPKELGCTACKVLLDYIDGQQVEEKKLLGYEVMLKGSTN